MDATITLRSKGIAEILDFTRMLDSRVTVS